MNTAAGECVYLVDDEDAVRDALAFLFASHGYAVQAFGSGSALLAAFEHKRPQIGCLVLDVRMEPMSGLQLFDELMARALRIPVIFLSGHGDIAMAVDALKRGAFDFVEKPFGNAALVTKVRAALQWSAQRQDQESTASAYTAKLAQLTERERQLMHRVAMGKLNKVIADEMHIAVRTVEVHRSRVFAKLGVRSAAELATLLTRLEAGADIKPEFPATGSGPGA